MICGTYKKINNISLNSQFREHRKLDVNIASILY